MRKTYQLILMFLLVSMCAAVSKSFAWDPGCIPAPDRILLSTLISNNGQCTCDVYVSYCFDKQQQKIRLGDLQIECNDNDCYQNQELVDFLNDTKREMFKHAATDALEKVLEQNQDLLPPCDLDSNTVFVIEGTKCHTERVVQVGPSEFAMLSCSPTAYCKCYYKVCFEMIDGKKEIRFDRDYCVSSNYSECTQFGHGLRLYNPITDKYETVFDKPCVHMDCP